MARVATIGVYGFDVETFLATLADAEVGLLLDLRQRRGVRGARYAWANSRRLQAALADAGVAYRHVKDLAPTTALRQAQYAHDDAIGVGKRDREVLADVYVEGYTRQVLDPFDLATLVDELPTDTTTSLLCVETDASACHRGLVAARLAEQHGVDVAHLTPT